MATACFIGRVLASVLIFLSNAFLLADLTRGIMAHLLLCQQCGEEVVVPQYRVATFKFCSRRCMALSSRMKSTTVCHVCAKPFEHISSRANKAKYCSALCYHKAMHLRGSVVCNCKHCGKEFRASPSEKRIYCSRACVNKVRKELWNPAFSTVRKSLVSRNEVKECQRCGFNSHPAILGVHHKDRNHRNNARDNLEVLCPNCHSIEHDKNIAH